MSELETTQRAIHRRMLTRNIELNIAVFALLLNFPWEILQAPLFAGMADGPFIDAIKGCAQGTLGDAVIMLLAYWAVSGVAESRDWILAPNGRQLSLFVAIGVFVTAAIEWLATRGYWVQSWTYSPAMPVVPGIGVGISPLLQWIILPLLVVWFVRRQLSAKNELCTWPRPVGIVSGCLSLLFNQMETRHGFIFSADCWIVDSVLRDSNASYGKERKKKERRQV